MSTIILTVAYFFNIIDYLFTTHWVNKFGIEIEANPLGRWLYDNNIAGFVKILVVGGLFILLGYLIKQYPKLTWVAYIPLVVYGIIVIYHLIILITIK